MFKSSAPGSLMLLGEHAVLHGKHALVCAVDKRITVSLVPRQDTKITIASKLFISPLAIVIASEAKQSSTTSPHNSALDCFAYARNDGSQESGDFVTTLSKLEITPPFQFVLATLKHFQKKLKTGCDIIIESDFSSQIGFASSAAVTVATLSALSSWLNLSLSKEELVKAARQIVRTVQGLGSGADVAAAVFGGIIGYRATPFWIEKHLHFHPITVVYSGNKTPTVEVVKHVQHYFSHQPKLLKDIFRAIDQCALDGIQCVRQQDWEGLGRSMNIQQGLMDALNVNTPTLTALIEKLRESPTILGAKVSGSGLGDCVIGLGETDYSGKILVNISPEGVTLEKN